jgi:hypothetical protein
MTEKQLPPFNIGDEVIDDNGEIGYVTAAYISANWDADGKLTSWSTNIRYRWDQPSYGVTRRVFEGEIEIVRPAEVVLPKPNVESLGGMKIQISNLVPEGFMLAVGTVCEKCGRAIDPKTPMVICPNNFPYGHVPNILIIQAGAETGAGDERTVKL